MADPQSRTPESERRASPSRGPGETGRAPEERSFQNGRELADSGRRAVERGADAWRQSMQPLAQMQAEMGRWFDDMWRQSMAGAALVPNAFRGATLVPAAFRAGGAGFPTADLRETDRAYRLAVELPGIRPQDVEVTVEGDMLAIRAAKAEDREEGEGAWHVSERRFGSFERTFPLPRDVDPEAIEAACRHGVLRVTLPKRTGASAGGRRIEVRPEG